MAQHPSASFYFVILFPCLSVLSVPRLVFSKAKNTRCCKPKVAIGFHLISQHIVFFGALGDPSITIFRLSW